MNERERVIELQRLLTSIPALNPESGGDGEWRKAIALKEYLKAHGFPEPVHYDTPDPRVSEGTRPNFAVRIGGERKSPCIWVMTHLDVVPPGERMDNGSWKGWQTDPFGLHVDGDILYGRGVEDNQQAITASVIAAERLIASAAAPPNDIALLFVSAEETGSVYGLKHLFENHPGLFGKDDLIIVPDGGNEDGSMIEIAEKSVLWIDFKTFGQQTHGSTPHLGNNACRAMAAMVMELDRRLHEKFSASDDIFRPPVSTFEPTRHARNVPNINTIPGEEHFSFDCRILPSCPIDDVLDTIRGVVSAIDSRYGTRTEMQVENRLDAPPPTPADAPVVAALRQALWETRGVRGRPLGLGGSTVAAVFREAARPAVVWSTIKGVAHQANEHALISNILADADVYEYLFRHGGG